MQSTFWKENKLITVGAVVETQVTQHKHDASALFLYVFQIEN